MSAPVKKCEVTPLEARCSICLDTGEVDQMGYLDCKACDVATKRAELESWAQDHCLAHVGSDDLWRIHQHALAAAPVVPVAAQPVVPEGWKLVPEEPTYEMFNASAKIDNEMFAGGSSHGADDGQVWAAMYGAAPDAPSLEAQPAGEVERDAARYRWLIAQTPCNIAVMLECSIGEINDEIDAAMAQGDKV